MLKKRADPCKELIKIETRLGPDYARMETIGIELKQIAGNLGASIKEEFADLDSVAVAPAQAAELKGTVSQIQSEIWLGMKKSEQNALTKPDLVKAVEQWSKASNGRVTVKVAWTAFS